MPFLSACAIGRTTGRTSFPLCPHEDARYNYWNTTISHSPGCESSYAVCEVVGQWLT